MRTVGLTLGMLLLVAVAHAAADEPLRVYGYGASRASVYVAPMKVAGAADTDSDVGPAVFAKKYLRGTVPLQVPLKPGSYLVSVVQAREQNMRDASLAANEQVWDGYDYHALVPQRSGTWRYAHCYVVDKKEGFPAEVLAVFTNQMPLDEVQSYDCGPQATRYTGSEDDAIEALAAAGVAMAFQDAVLEGLKAGAKVLLRAGDRRFAIQTDGTVALRVTTASGQGAWAGHRLSIASVE